METILVPDPEFVEQVITGRNEIEVNGYRSRGQIEIDIEGENRVWHSMKGGHTGKSGDFETLYDPIKDEWLKVGYPGQNGETIFSDALERNVPFAEEALKIAGLPEYARKIKSSSITARGVTGFGVITPHLGSTLEQIQKKLTFLTANTPTDDGLTTRFRAGAETLFINVYKIAYSQAIWLLMQSGFYVTDPNPGNIILVKSEKGIHVAQIDTVNRGQIRDHYPNLPQEERKIKLSGSIGTLTAKYERKASDLIGRKVQLKDR